MENRQSKWLQCSIVRTVKSQLPKFPNLLEPKNWHTRSTANRSASNILYL